MTVTLKRPKHAAVLKHKSNTSKANYLQSVSKLKLTTNKVPQHYQKAIKESVIAFTAAYT